VLELLGFVDGPLGTFGQLGPGRDVLPDPLGQLEAPGRVARLSHGT
jgi:hypothetical protein